MEKSSKLRNKGSLMILIESANTLCKGMSMSKHRDYYIIDTMMRLIDTAQVRKYRPGALLAAQNKNSPINFKFSDYYNIKYIKRAENAIEEIDSKDEEEITMFKRAIGRISKKNICKFNLLSLIFIKNK